jgi:hypothetical protein
MFLEDFGAAWQALPVLEVISTGFLGASLLWELTKNRDEEICIDGYFVVLEDGVEDLVERKT